MVAKFLTKRRMFITIAVAVSVTSLVLFNSAGQEVAYDDSGLDAGDFSRPFAVPPLLEDMNADSDKARYELTANSGSSRFFVDKLTRTLGYNGSYLGPTIRVKNGERVSIKVNNLLPDTTTVHWHGLVVPAAMDGGPRQPIGPGRSWEATFRVRQDASTLWYRPDAYGLAGEQLYYGLAGALIVDDERATGLGLPQDYGRNDFPVLIQDRKFASTGELEYRTSAVFSANGIFGDKILINGIIKPVLKVAKEKIRLRIINASNTRVYNLSLSNRSGFAQIASDGGLLAAPANLRSLEIAPGERNEIIVDFSQYSAGQEVFLRDPEFSMIKFVVTEETAKDTEVPRELGRVKRVKERAGTKVRQFELTSAVADSGEASLMINGKSFDIDRIDERVKKGGTEVWEIHNPAHRGENFSSHPFHIHGVRFQVLERNGRAPAAPESGWKDTIFLRGNDRVKLIMSFSEPGVFTYHCDMLEHEDAGMMGQVKVE